jgi:pyruvate/oxaloacetate carboxyltransferase
MKKIRFIDQTIRDAQQSLWAYLMRTDMIEPIASVMDNIGFDHIATNGSQGFVVQVRHLGEDPWERIRLLSKKITRTPLRGSYMTASLASFDIDTPREVIDLWIRTSVANGIKAFWVCDYQSDMDRFYHFARLAKDLGTQVISALMYTYSPAHDDAHWAEKTRMIAGVRDVVDGIMVEDAGGVITPERTKRLVEVIKENSGGLPLEFHSHCNSGLAPLCYLEAVKAGADALHTTVGALANGTSLPAIETVIRNTRRLGFSDDIDDEALSAVSEHFQKISQQEGMPVGIPQEYDLFHYEHQVPGGMMTNLKRQLAEINQEHRLDEFLEEVVRVRKEFGYPVMATPFSQIVGAQAVENCMVGERYKRILDESVKYVAGHYGPPPSAIAPIVLNRIEELPEAKELLSWEPTKRNRSLESIREEIGKDLTDEELLLRALIPGRAAIAKKVKKSPPKAKAQMSPTPSGAVPVDFPTKFSVDVDGEIFQVKVIPEYGGNGQGPTEKADQPSDGPAKEVPIGAVIPEMAGLLVSLKVKESQQVEKGDLIATIEAMKMMRDVTSPYSGRVSQICIGEGEMIESNDVLMVVEETQ